MKSSVSPEPEVKVTYKKRKKKQIISKFRPRKKIKTEKSASHSCFICSDRFDQESKLKSHILSEHEGKGPYPCSKCEREFSRISSLKNHITHLHNENTTDENSDNSGENSDNSLENSEDSQEDSDHSQENSDDSEEDSSYDSEENFDKNDCYAAIKILQKHISAKEIIGKKKVHEGKKNKRYACNKCEKTYITPSALKLHVEKNHERKRHHCHICEDHFAYKNDLLKHILRIHKGVGKPYKPRVKRIDRIPQWSDFRNLKSSTPDIRNQTAWIKKCSYCLAQQKGNPYKKEYKISPRKNVDELLTFEELDHSIENKCTCAELNQEVLVHDGEKPFQCSKCEAGYKFEKNLLEHIQSVHEGIMYDCPSCEGCFSAINSLERHVSRFHGEKVLNELRSQRQIASVHDGKKLENEKSYAEEHELKKHTGNVHEAVLNKHVENESFNEKEIETTKKLKKELSENGFILCEKETCKMGCLSIAGFRSHQNKCTGFMKDGVSYTLFILLLFTKK